MAKDRTTPTAKDLEDLGFSSSVEFPSSVSRPTTTNHLLLIAIDEYAGGIASLSNPVRDAEALMDILLKKYGFLAENTTFLKNQEATRDNIIEIFHDYADRLTKEDNLLIFYAGHGKYLKRNIMEFGYWLPTNAKPDRIGSFISETEITPLLSAIDAHHILLISDSCFSQNMFLNPNNRGEAAYDEDRDSHSSRYGFASGRKEVPDGPAGKHSPFAKELLRFLEENTQPMVRVSILIDVVSQAVAANSRDQFPMGLPLMQANHGGGQFVFRQASPQSPEERAWAQAQATNTEHAYDRYLDDFPKGKHAQEAHQKLKEQAEEEAWQNAISQASIVGYRNYETKYPEGKHAQEAKQRRIAIRDGQEQAEEAKKREKFKKEEEERLKKAEEAKKQEALREIWRKEAEQERERKAEDAKKQEALRKQEEERLKKAEEAKRKATPTNGQLKTIAIKNTTFDLIYIEGGTFTMGDEFGDLWDACKPVHEVTLTKGYWMGKTPVTQALYEAVMGSNPRRFKNQSKNPVENVSWNDAKVFLQKLNELLGEKESYRLPTEAEWEFAARGGTKSQGYKYAGSNNLDEVAWYDKNSGGKTHPVAEKKANELGLYDMSGNVWEWCEDDWHGNYKGAPDDGKAWIASPRARRRVSRGGSSGLHAPFFRVASRNDYAPGARLRGLGFRLVLCPQ